MDNNRLNQLIGNLDNDLMIQELDELMDDIDIDMDSISQKAHWKLRKGQKKMTKNKKKIAGIVAASLIAVCGVTSVYASEISQFIQSLIHKTGVYDTVVDGQTYYLAAPIALDNGNRLTKAMFDRNALQIRVEMADGSFSDARIRIDGAEMEPFGMEGHNLFFRDVKPTSQFELILDGKSYPITLSSSTPVVGDGTIVEAEPNDIHWISMGYKKMENGVQILTAFKDSKIQLLFLSIPEKDTIKQSFKNDGGGSVANSTREELQPLVGVDKNGGTYVYAYDANDMGRPLTKFTTSAPADREITLTVPGIAVSYDKNQTLNISLPAIGEKQETPQTIDLGLQKMLLQTIERTSETTATLTFALNTGENKDVRIWEAAMGSKDAKNGDLLWQNGTCTMNVTFDKNLTNLKVSIENPCFIIDGDWVLHIK